ncbi:uncharacterized membrane protein YjgN (DUF898 family) [Enterobacter sp. BIGb0383]|uniref:YjgN family protein n=1 Tax=unclassified Enterobacter TaxID=2608935 RepID=UPI000F49FBE3|nr:MULTISPECIES: DUF898 family protein [unclassified Enterobacter]ROP60024.1 uncharacterized membrane protein YjgN (DUF898 family) [Enterobacter sp. BIGb0383]ROS08508.1 uncharacterized membrane protein YjgN (DUF898 family) [Enterobacter sp. BIGb0359]
MSGVDLLKTRENSRSFVFTGSGKGYFPVWIVNVLLTIVTLGLFLPWALVRARRYFYENTSLSGERFSFHATGGSIFVGWLGLMVLYIIFIAAVASNSIWLTLLMVVLFILFVPWLVTQGLRYQLHMTQLNGVRFNFRASPLQAWWVMLGLPLLVAIAVAVVSGIAFSASTSAGSIDGIITGGVIGTLILIFGTAIIQGVYAAKWYGLLVNNLQYGTQRFSAQFSVKKCTVIYLLSMLLFIPFIFVALWMIVPPMVQIAQMSAFGASEEAIMSLLASVYTSLIMAYLLYFVGILVCFSFAFVKLRNYLYSMMSMEGGIQFRSTAATGHFVWLVLSNIALVSITLGLAWPWAKARVTRYLLENTHVDGDLDALNPQDHSEQPGKDPASLLARGLSVMPFAL